MLRNTGAAVLIVTLAHAGSQAQVQVKAPARTTDALGLVASSIGGAAGLFRLHTAEAAPPMTFRVGLHSEVFSSSDFLIQGDENARVIGTTTFSFSPFRKLETFLFLTSAANRNTRTDPERRDPKVILALGDFGFGAKTQFQLSPVGSVGGEFFIKFLNSIGGTSLDASSTNAYLGAIASLDYTRAKKSIPLRGHVNAGFLVDRSQDLCPATGTSDSCGFADWEDQSDRLAAEFGYGINRNRIQFALGLDAPLSRLAWPLQPLIEYHIDVATGDADPLYEEFFTADDDNDGVPDNPDLAKQVDGSVSQYLTIGLRLRPARGLFLDLGSDIGVQSPGFGFGPATPPWNLIVGVSYAYDPTARREVVVKEVVKVVEKKVPGGAAASTGKPATGRIRGRVIDGATGQPIEGAVIAFPGRDLTGLASDEAGGFKSYDFAPGKVTLAVHHGKYEAAQATVAVEVDKETAFEVKLTAAATAGGSLTGRLVSAQGAGISGATVRVVGPENKEVQSHEQGAFSVDLAPGDYVARAEAAGYLSRERNFRVTEGGKSQADIVLPVRPTKPSVAVDSQRKRIRFAKKLAFDGDGSALVQASKMLLDELVDLLVNRPDVKRVRVEAHTDNRGNGAKLRDLSQERADAVRAYLLEQGIDGSRVEATGVGPARPIAPNFLASGRAKNRRVEFVVTQ